MASATLPAKKVLPRKDPRPRTHDGANVGIKILNRRPDRHYVGVSPEEQGNYEGRGYQFVRCEDETSERFSARTCKNKGDVPEYRGHALMWISQEMKDVIDQFGDDGDSGWAEADKIEAAILDKKGPGDPMRGIHRRYVQLESDISPLQQVG